jgi:hypothetical protein
MVPRSPGSSYSRDHRTRLEEHVPPADRGLDRDDVLVEQPQRHRVLVDHVVEEVATRAGRGEPPGVPVGLQAGLEGRVGLTDHGVHPEVIGPADGPLGDELLGQLQRGVVPEALADPQDQAGFGSGPIHGQGLGDRVGQRLLA